MRGEGLFGLEMDGELFLHCFEIILHRKYELCCMQVNRKNSNKTGNSERKERDTFLFEVVPVMKACHTVGGRCKLGSGAAVLLMTLNAYTGIHFYWQWEIVLFWMRV